MLVLREARHGAKIVDRSEAGVGASESRERHEDTELPHVGQTLETGEVGAEVFVVGIFRRGFGLAHDLTYEVNAAGSTVGASESWCADVDWPALVPEDRVRCSVGGGIKAGDQ